MSAWLDGGQSFPDIVRCGRCRDDVLKTRLALPCGIRFHNTIHRVFGPIDADHYREVVIA